MSGPLGIARSTSPHRRADNGTHGKGKDLHGRSGAALEVRVPMGTVAYDMYTDEKLAELGADD